MRPSRSPNPPMRMKTMDDLFGHQPQQGSLFGGAPDRIPDSASDAVSPSASPRRETAPHREGEGPSSWCGSAVRRGRQE